MQVSWATETQLNKIEFVDLVSFCSIIVTGCSDGNIVFDIVLKFFC